MSKLSLPPIEQLRRDAKRLRRAAADGDTDARARMAAHAQSDPPPLRHADALHAIAREHGFASWPRLTAAVEASGLNSVARVRRMKIALLNGHHWMVQRLLEQDRMISRGDIHLACALFDLHEVQRILAEDPSEALLTEGTRRPILTLAFSKHLQTHPERETAMLAIADTLLMHGADVDDAMPVSPDNDHKLSALYGTIGHSGNMPLAQWFLKNGANPNDGESLYHATELGHSEGLRLLLEHGADPAGTNALLRALDFNNHEMVSLLLAHGARADDFDDTPVGGEAPWVVPALHQAARRGNDARMVALLLDAGARPDRVYQGAGAYAFARVFGSAVVAEAIAARGGATSLTREETLLARAAAGQDSPGAFIDPEALPPAYRDIIRVILHLPGKLDHVKRLVALGVEYDRPDTEGLTPVQVAGWEGLPEMMGYLLSLKPDLSHVNGYGGTLLSTIIHGSENAPDRDRRDHIACLEMALHHGVALPRADIESAGREDVAAFLSDWAETHPGQVV